MDKHTVRLGTIAALGVLAIWVGTVIPRVVTLRQKNNHVLHGEAASWTPPMAPSPGVSPPDTNGVDWPSLSSAVDTHGIYIVDYNATGQRGVSGKRRNPYNIAAFGIYCARRYLDTESEDELLLALRQFDYLVASARPTVIAGEPTHVWCADFDLGYQYHARAPWRSAYFQVRCLDALLWATWLTGDPHYRELAEASLSPLGRSVDEGGLAYVTKNRGLFFQEVVTSPLHHILNGNLNVLIGIHRFAEYTASASARRIFERGVQGTVDLLPRYDKKAYSLYSLSPHPGFRNHFNVANPTYHHLHVAQLRTLHEITGRPIFDEYARKWEKRGHGPFDALWSALFIMFKDAMKLRKAL